MSEINPQHAEPDPNEEDESVPEPAELPDSDNGWVEL